MIKERCAQDLVASHDQGLVEGGVAALEPAASGEQPRVDADRRIDRGDHSSWRWGIIV